MLSLGLVSSLALVWDRERQTRNSQAGLALDRLGRQWPWAAAGTAGLDKHQVGNEVLIMLCAVCMRRTLFSQRQPVMRCPRNQAWMPLLSLARFVLQCNSTMAYSCHASSVSMQTRFLTLWQSHLPSSNRRSETDEAGGSRYILPYS